MILNWYSSLSTEIDTAACQLSLVFSTRTAIMLNVLLTCDYLPLCDSPSPGIHLKPSLPARPVREKDCIILLTVCYVKVCVCVVPRTITDRHPSPLSCWTSASFLHISSVVNKPFPLKLLTVSLSQCSLTAITSTLILHKK